MVNLNLASHQLSSKEISVEVLEKFEWYYKEIERNKVEEAFDEIKNLNFEKDAATIKSILSKIQR